MSVKALSAVWEESRARGVDLLVLLAMADWADHQGRCFPSYVQISKKARVSRAAVASAIRQLVDIGELERVSGGHAPSKNDDDDDPVNIRSQWRNAYRILLVRPRRQVAHGVDAQAVQPADGQVVHRMDGFDGAEPSDAQAVHDLDYLTRRARAPGSPNEAAQVVQTTRSHKRIRPSGRPSEELSAGAAPPPPAQNDEDPDQNLGVITKLAHIAIDELGPHHPDLVEAVKSFCAANKIRPYPSHVVHKAIDSARWQRERRV